MRKTLFLFLSILTMGTLWAQGSAEVKVSAECGDYVEMTAIPQTGYHFLYWEMNGTQVSDNTTFTIQAYSDSTFEAVFEIDSFLIQFVNYDGTELQSGYVDYGVKPTYDGATPPTKPADVQYTYTFDSWSPTIYPADKDQIYTAVYTKVVNKYTITFVNEDDPSGYKVLQSSDWEYGSTPVYEGDDPIKIDPTGQYTYAFKGWDHEISPVTGEDTYTAVFQQTTNEYSVNIFNDGNGTAVYDNGSGNIGTSGLFPYGTVLTIKATPNDCYEFDNWSLTEHTTSEFTYIVTKNLNITAFFKKLKYTITIRTKTGDTTQGKVTGNKK